MRREVGADTRLYRTTRRWPGPVGAASRAHVQVGAPLEPGPLEHFLTARWGLFSTWYGGRTAWAPVHHVMWGLHEATLLDSDDELVAAAGLQVAGEPHVMWSAGVRVRIGRPRLLPR
jgi:uncharacterized protein YqjF (DUF2071 family)